jgi:hypothetical protein
MLLSNLSRKFWIITTYFFKLISFWAILVLVSWLFYIPFTLPIPGIRDYWISFAIDYLPGFIWVFIIIVFQSVLARFALLQDSTVDGSIDNRRFYHLVSYFFYFNVSNLYFSIKSDQVCATELKLKFTIEKMIFACFFQDANLRLIAGIDFSY